jgi:hypothetical protein
MNVSSDEFKQGDTIMKTQEATTTTATKKARSKKSRGKKIEAKPTTKSTKPVTKRPAAKTAKVSKQPAKDASPSGSKSAIVLDLLHRKEGATLAEIAKAIGWQNHSIRGFVSGHVTKKLGLKVESTKSEAGERIYRVLS